MAANQGSQTVDITAFSTNHFSVLPFFSECPAKFRDFFIGKENYLLLKKNVACTAYF